MSGMSKAVSNARYGMTEGRARWREKGRGGKKSSETAGYASPVKDLKADAQLMISSFLYNATFSGIGAKCQEFECFADQFHPPKNTYSEISSTSNRNLFYQPPLATF